MNSLIRCAVDFLSFVLPASGAMHFYTRIEYRGPKFSIRLRIPVHYNHAAIAQFSLPSFAYYLCGLYSLCVRLLWGPSTTYVVSQNDILDFILYVERHCPVSAAPSPLRPPSRIINYITLPYIETRKVFCSLSDALLLAKRWKLLSLISRRDQRARRKTRHF